MVFVPFWGFELKNYELVLYPIFKCFIWYFGLGAIFNLINLINLGTKLFKIEVSRFIIKIQTHYCNLFNFKIMSQEPLSLKQRIAKMAGEEEEIIPEEFSNLILDDTPIQEITEDDKNYLNKFANLEKLCMNATGLKNLGNLPDKLNIYRVSIRYF